MDRLQFWGLWLKANPVDFLIYLVMLVTTVLISLILHEVAHGYVAYRCGDPTAKMLGRLSLNPLKHLDPMGTICLLLLGFGWAKPVPVNPRNFRNYRRDDLLVSLAGVTVNLTLFIVTLFFATWLGSVAWQGDSRLIRMGAETIFASISAGNGQSISLYTDHAVAFYFQVFFTMLARLNLGLGLFNLLPFPPLDGFHVLNDIALKGKLQLNQSTFRIAQTVLMVLCFTGVLSKALSTGINFVFDAVQNLYLMLV